MKILFCFILLVLFIQSVFCEKLPATCGQTNCPHYHRPVCATNGRIRRTFHNQCAVRTFNECSSDEKYNIIRKGQC
ncbi:CLUMA_CG019444, isoform A [Clunio marinus]|uniref:CLUMA_CG019444, isoform A n=1 Tax=Clunio marinus TaxID=568069 RepID=A0A1J1J3B2_9DIPT|nr:CLUMA_CG019444, isoform A [Clunio marinus]